MLTVSLTDAAGAALAALPDKISSALTGQAATLAAALETRIRDKLSGAVLNPRSGALARAIVTTIEQTASGVAVTVGVDADIKYAAIHEFGGTIPPHEIVPDKARALAFVVGGKQTFAARVSLPAVTLPERSYLRSSLAEMAEEIAEGFAGAVTETI